MSEKECTLMLSESENFSRNLHEIWHQNGTTVNEEEQDLEKNTHNNHEELCKSLKNLMNGSSSSLEKLYDEIFENGQENSNYSLEDNEEEEIPKIRRCSSLKTGKTPPNTPNNNKKIVRFADALGLDLIDVKTFIDEIPKIPNSAFNDLKNFDDNYETNNTNNNIKQEKLLIPLFEQPINNINFLNKVKTNYVSLETILIDDQINFLIKGIVRVRNVDFNKTVFVRYSINSWKNYIDIKCNYIENSCDGFSDKFQFFVYGNMLNYGETLEFAIVYQAKGEQFWDNNDGKNYLIQCISKNVTVTPPLTHHILPSDWNDEHWGATFY